MEKQNIAYITSVFLDKEKEEISNWSKKIDEKHLFFALKDGEIDGGNMTDDLHLTLFYGLNEDQINKDEVLKYINSTTLGDIEVGDIGVFPVPNQDCKVLYLSIKDENGIIESSHKELSKFPHFSEYQKNKFTPHLTVAFVKKDFDINNIKYTGPKVLHVKEILYHSKRGK